MFKQYITIKKSRIRKTILRRIESKSVKSDTETWFYVSVYTDDAWLRPRSKPPTWKNTLSSVPGENWQPDPMMSGTKLKPLRKTKGQRKKRVNTSLKDKWLGNVGNANDFWLDEFPCWWLYPTDVLKWCHGAVITIMISSQILSKWIPEDVLVEQLMWKPLCGFVLKLCDSAGKWLLLIDCSIL